MNAVRKAASKRVLVAVPAVALLAAVLAGCTGDSPGDDPSAEAATVSPRPSPNFAEEITEFSYQGHKGQTPIELLRENDPDAEVEGKGKDAHVVAIRGRTADESKGQSWTLFIDGKEKDPAVATKDSKDGQAITWRLTTK